MGLSFRPYYFPCGTFRRFFPLPYQEGETERGKREQTRLREPSPGLKFQPRDFLACLPRVRPSDGSENTRTKPSGRRKLFGTFKFDGIFLSSFAYQDLKFFLNLQLLKMPIFRRAILARSICDHIRSPAIREFGKIGKAIFDLPDSIIG